MNQRARPPYNPWRDVDGTPITIGARVEQIAIAKAHGALTMRLHQHGEVIRRGHYLRLYVHFDGDTEPVSIRPHLVRVLPIGTNDATPDQRAPLTLDELIAHLIQLRTRYPDQGPRPVLLLNTDDNGDGLITNVDLDCFDAEQGRVTVLLSHPQP